VGYPVSPVDRDDVVRFVRVDGRDLGPLDAARTTSSRKDSA
jgi:hypothetical protein